jgi:hypothetical protein
MVFVRCPPSLASLHPFQYCVEHREAARLKTQLRRTGQKTGPLDPQITHVGIGYNSTLLSIPPTFTEKVDINGTNTLLKFPPNLSTTWETSGPPMSELGEMNRKVVMELLQKCGRSWVVRLDKNVGQKE